MKQLTHQRPGHRLHALGKTGALGVACHSPKAHITQHTQCQLLAMSTSCTADEAAQAVPSSADNRPNRYQALVLHVLLQELHAASCAPVQTPYWPTRTATAGQGRRLCATHVKQHHLRHLQLALVTHLPSAML